MHESELIYFEQKKCKPEKDIQGSKGKS